MKFSPLSFSEWCYETDIEDRYRQFHDEYGDSACSLSEYKDWMYKEYLEKQLSSFSFSAKILD